MSEHPSPEDLMALTDGELTPAERESIRAHVGGCGICRARVAELDGLSATLHGWRVEPAPPGLQARVEAAACSAASSASSGRAPVGGTGHRRRVGTRWLAVAAGLAGLALLGAGAIVCHAAPCSDRLSALISGAPAAHRTADADTFEQWWVAQPRLSRAGPLAGSTQVLFLSIVDWRCPACRIWYQLCEQVLPEFRGASVTVRYLDFPLDASCNEAVKGTVHPGACEAAGAVRMAAARGRADAMRAWLFAHVADELGPANIKAAAREVAGVTDFDAEYARVLPDIARDVADARALHVASTPTAFINGVRITDWVNRDLSGSGQTAQSGVQGAGNAWPTAAELEWAIRRELGTR